MTHKQWIQRAVLGAVALFMTLAAAPAQAVLYRFTSSNADGPIVLTLSFLDGAVDQNPTAGIGRYDNSAVSMLLETSTFTMRHDGPMDFVVVNVQNPAMESFIVLQGTSVTVDPLGSANPSFGLVLRGPGLMGGSEALPLSLPLTLPGGSQGAIVYEEIDGDLFYGTIRTLEVNPAPPIPEPATAATAGLALGALAVGLLRRRW